MAGVFKTVFGDALRVLRVLVNEVFGAFFLVLAVIGGSFAVQEYQKYSDAPDTGAWRIWLTIAFSLSMLGFGLHSFWKAWKVK